MAQPSHVDDDKRARAQMLIAAVMDKGAVPFASASGRILFQAPKGTITSDEKKGLRDCEREVHDWFVAKFGELPPLPALDEPPPASAQVVDALMDALEDSELSPWVSGIELHPFDSVHTVSGPLTVDGKMCSFGRVTFIGDDVVVDGALLTISDVEPNWLVIDGDLRCRDLMVVANSTLLVTGDLEVEGVACAATRDSTAIVLGGMVAGVVVSGQGGGAFQCESLITHSLYGWVGDVDEDDVMASSQGGPIGVEVARLQLDPDFVDAGTASAELIQERLAMNEPAVGDAP